MMTITKKQTKEDEGFYQTCSPFDIIFDILLKLPVKSLLRFRCLSTHCCTLIDDPEFSKTHLLAYQSSDDDLLLLASPRHPKPNHITLPIQTAIYQLDKNGFFFLPPLISLQPLLNLVGQSNDLKGRQEDSGIEVCNYCHINIVNCCNGLLCMEGHGNWEGMVFLSNPFKQECLILPPASEYPDQSLCDMLDYLELDLYERYGLGYDESTDTFKVVHIFLSCHFHDLATAEVYDLSAKEWRRISSSILTSAESLIINQRPVYCYGALHWLANRNRMVSFDMRKEEFYITSLPNIVSVSDQYSHDLVSLIRSLISCPSSCELLTLWKGSLAYFEIEIFLDGGPKIEIWVFKDDQKEWVKEYTMPNISSFNLMRAFYWDEKPVLGLTSHKLGLLLRLREGNGVTDEHLLYDSLYYYKQETDELNRVPVSLFFPEPIMLDVILFTGSLISLENYGGSSKVKKFIRH